MGLYFHISLKLETRQMCVLIFRFRRDCLQLMKAAYFLDRRLGRHKSQPKYSCGLPHVETNMRPYNTHTVLVYVFIALTAQN